MCCLYHCKYPKVRFNRIVDNRRYLEISLKTLELLSSVFVSMAVGVEGVGVVGVEGVGVEGVGVVTAGEVGLELTALAGVVAGVDDGDAIEGGVGEAADGGDDT